jgi:hypothetical protein
VTNEERIRTGEELLTIADRLRALRGRFDTSTTPCSSCGLAHARNFAEKKGAEQLDGAVGRLEKVVELIGSALDAEEGRS